MENFLEKIGLRKSREQMRRQETIKGLEKYLRETVDQYKMNQSRFRNMPNTFLGSGHQEDTKDIAAAQNSLASLKNIILETAQKLGKDGNDIIKKADEEVERVHEGPSAG